MNITEFVKHRKHIVTGWKDVSGGAFFRAFDTAFGLRPITEFSYLLRYLERLSVNADEVGATPPEPIARAVFVFRHHLFHLGSPRNYMAATGSTVLRRTGFSPHSPPVAATIYLQKVRRAIRQNLCHLFLCKRGDDGELVFPCETHLSTPIPPIQTSRFASSPSHNYFLWSSCAKVPAGTLLDANPRKAETTEPNTMNGKTMQRNAEVGGIPPFWPSSARQLENQSAAVTPQVKKEPGTPDTFFLVCLRSDDVESLATPGFDSPGTPFNLRDYDSLRP